jgi:hypothetical protein
MSAMHMVSMLRPVEKNNLKKKAKNNFNVPNP